MLELSRTESEIVRCLARREVLDGLPELEGAFACRVASDDLMLVAPGGSGIAEAASVYLEAADPNGLAFGQSDGWSVWTLAGARAAEAFARLSAIPPATPPAFVQGAIAGVPGKALVLDDRVHLLVVASLGHHLRERILAACADLDPVEVGS